MKKKTISLQITDWQDKNLEAIKNKVGIPRAVLIRNAINVYLEKFPDTIEEEEYIYHALGSDKL